MDHQIKKQNHMIDCIIGVILLLWPGIIGPEIILQGTYGEEKKTPTQKNEKFQLPDTFPLKKKSHRQSVDIDEAVFLLSFKRQAQKELVSCLNASKMEHNSFVLQGRLSKTGKISQIISPFQNDQLNTCIVKSIEDMHFENLTRDINTDYVQISWRVDW